jgi:ATP-dependent exoDNAse (exonuclease V) beta subunit
MTTPLDQDNAARQRIRESLDESLIVEAAAGTGKTSELIRRIVAVIRTGRATVDRIVAVTFTRKAAGELRLRLRAELDNARIAATDAVERGNLETALARLEEAHIGTIHSFCAEILRQRPVEARIPPGFEEIDEVQAARLYDRAFDAWIQRNLQSMPEGLRRTLSRASIENSTEDDGPLDRLRRAGAALVAWRDFRQRWRRKPLDRSEDIRQLIRGIEDLARVAAACTVSNHPVRKHLQCAVDFVARLQRSQALGRFDVDELEAQLIRFGGDLGKEHNKGNRKFSTQHSRDEVIAMIDQRKAALDDFEERTNADLAALLQAEMQDLIDLYEDMKSRSGKLDFVDLLTRTRDLITQSDDVRRLLQTKFSHIFVDEFQDTDPVQAEILILLSADDPIQTNWHHVRPVRGKLFVVGDPKQSIYRFRRADIILYQALCERLSVQGVAILQLSRSFRAVKPIQDVVNAAFAPDMQSNRQTGQPAYVPLLEFTPRTEQPGVIVLPVPRPYGFRGVTKTAILESLPDAIAAYVEWLIRDSGWKVRPPDGSGDLVTIASEHIAVLFRRFMSHGTDVTRGYVHALEARNIPHQLWQARSFHQREEVECLRAALNAIEWPDDELSVFATLKGSLFAIPETLLFRFRQEIGSFHPFRPQLEDLKAEYDPIKEALALLANLHRRRNWCSAAETVNALLEASRAHATFALRPSGNQVLANIYHVCNLARANELYGALSFRGFVEQLNEESESEDSGEAPILEEGSEGVRIMTVHAAKGLEFPVVILADMTANAAQREADKHIHAEENLCALRLMGCSPWDLLEHQNEEHERDVAEGVRIAYVAATRARDLLVVPAVGDAPFDNGWLASLNKAIYPEPGSFRTSNPAPMCPNFGEVTVLRRPPEYDGLPERSVRPGLHAVEGCQGGVVWWDPGILNLNVEANFGLRQKEILAERGSEARRGRLEYESWQACHQDSIQRGQTPTVNVFLATDGLEPPPGYADRITVERVEREGQRAQGPRFGTLVHSVLRDVPFTAQYSAILAIAQTHARLLGATPEETDEAARAVDSTLRHPLIVRARQSSRCHRELPVLVNVEGTGLLEAVIDLAFLEEGKWLVVDFKTDAEDQHRARRYRRQVGWYAQALEQTTATPAQGCLLHV